jgi:hypothetical protein
VTSATVRRYEEPELHFSFLAPRSGETQRENDTRRKRAVPPTDPVARARAAGVTAAWTGRCDGAVQLARLAGPRSAPLTSVDAQQLGLEGNPPWDLSDTAVRAAVYERVLTTGTQFDFYRWINLRDLAAVWHLLKLPDGIAAEWATVLQAAGLLDT